MNAIDRLFQDQLEGHSTPPSAGAWERIEAGLTKKPRPLAWMRWAAVIVPAAVAVVIWTNRPVASTQGVAQAETIQPVRVAPQAMSAPAVVKDRPASSRRIASRKPALASTAEVDLPIETVALLPEAAPMEDLTIETQSPITIAETVAEPETQPVVIVYTLETIASDAAEKPSSLERVVEFARAVKHSDPISNLRGFKDELLALDLRKKSTKKN